MSSPRGIRLELLGGFRLIVSGRPSPRPLTARQQQLLACLALSGGGPITRQQIAGRLWPDSADAQALTNLRREWHHLREDCPELAGAIDAGTRTLGWRSGKTPQFDVSDFERAAGRGLQGDSRALDEAARLYRGDLLPDCAAEWIHADRERLRRQALGVLTQLVERLEQEQAYGDAIERGQQLLRIDSLNEPTWCALMRCHARRGERATALHLYQQCASLLKQELDVQPNAATRRTYREILDVEDEAPAALAPPRTQVYPLAGREAEWSLLRRTWQSLKAGGQQLLLIRGEAGIGKTRLAEELVDWCRSRGVRVVTARCYAGDGRLAYAPIAAWLQSDALRPALMSLDAVWLTEIARLRPELLIARPDVTAPEPKLEAWQRSRLFDALTHVFQAAAPALLVLDDLQWSDADTLDWLHYFLRSPAATECLVVGTVRAEEEHDNHPLGAVLAELDRIERLRIVPLGPLDQTASAKLADEVAEHPLDPETQARTFRETEGHPLFIVERGRMESSGAVGREAPLSPRVQSVVAARLARLSDQARAVAEVAAAIGRDFSFEILAQASDLEEDAVVRALDELWRRHVVRVQAGERWDFSHDRIREVAYGSIGPAQARLIHRRIAQALERTFASDLDLVSAPIATHLDRGGQSARAIPFLERAAHAAIRISAIEEGIRCLTYALSLLDQTAPGRDRDERELSFRAQLSSLLTYARGYAAVESEQNVERAVDLARTLGRGEVPVRWLWGLWSVHFVRGDIERARQAATQAFEQSRSDPSYLCDAHHAMAGTLVSSGEFDAARRHFDAALAAYDERAPRLSTFGSDLGVFTRAWSAHALWLLGETDAAAARADEAIAFARKLGHVYSETLALAYAGLTHQFRRDIAKVSECANAVVALSERYGFAYYRDWAGVLLGWVSGQEGKPQRGVRLIETALTHLDAQRAQGRRPYYLSLLAETLMAAGHRDRAASVLDTAIATAVERGDVWWLPELRRLKNEFERTATRTIRERRSF